VFYLIRDDGWLDCYDFIYRHNEVAYSHRVSEHALSVITICTESPKCESMLAIGDEVGNINILKVGDSLRLFDESERKEVDEAFRREKERETQIAKKRKKGAKKTNKKGEEEAVPYDTDKLEMEF
jgi:dynein intermediate chain 2